MIQVFSVVLIWRDFNFCMGFYLFKISSRSKYGLVGSNGCMVSFSGLLLRCSLCSFNLMWFGNTKELSEIGQLVYVRWVSIVNLQVPFSIMVLVKLSGEDFWNTWFKWIGDGVVLEAMRVTGVAQDQYEQMLVILILISTVVTFLKFISGDSYFEIFLNALSKDVMVRISSGGSKRFYSNLYCFGDVDFCELRVIRFWMIWAYVNGFPWMIWRSGFLRMKFISGVLRGTRSLNQSYTINGYWNVALRHGVMELYGGFVYWNIGISWPLGNIKPESCCLYGHFKNIFL